MGATEPLALAASPTVDERPCEAEDGWYWASSPYVPTPQVIGHDPAPAPVSVALLPRIRPLAEVETPSVARIHRWAVWRYGLIDDPALPMLIERRLGSGRGVLVSRGR